MPRTARRGRPPAIESERERDWTSRAACRGVDPELFFPVSESGTGLRRAKQICDRCPVSGSCYERALALGAAGIWGGTTTEQRRVVQGRVRDRGNPVRCQGCGGKTWSGRRLCRRCREDQDLADLAQVLGVERPA